MYRLVHFQATNIIGFMSGLGKKKFDLDLRPYKDKNMFVIIGDNASGKSTFLSLIHPTHMPADGRTKFVIPKKEGTIIRTYDGDDGTIIVSKCIYTPVHGDKEGHNSKCYLSVQKPGDDEPIEMNPSGNVASYNALLYTYFGINKDYVNFASYSDAVAGIVSMTDTERKNSVPSLIPNTGRFELAYNTVNDKYKELRNLARNVAQKIMNLKDMDTLDDDYRKVTKELAKAIDTKDAILKKLAKAEGRVKEISHGQNIDELMAAYQKLLSTLATYESRMTSMKRAVLNIADSLNLDVKPDTIMEDLQMDHISSQIIKYEKKVAKTETTIQSSGDRIDKLSKELSQTESDIEQSESVLYSLQSQDVSELEKTRDNYIDQLNKLEYTTCKEHYENMNYTECVAFMRNAAMINQMVQALYDEYGDLVTQYFDQIHTDRVEVINADLNTLSATIETKTARKDMIYRKLIEHEQYQKFQDVLDQRPKTCHDDTCPFIANAVKWARMSGEIADLKEEYRNLEVEITSSQDQIAQCQKKLELRQTAQNLINFIHSQEELLKRYLNVTVDSLYHAIAHGSWEQLIDIMKLKRTAAILSEKDFYIKITTQLLPEVEHSIEVAKAYGKNRELVLSQLDRLHHTEELLMDELNELHLSSTTSQRMKKMYQQKLDSWRLLRDTYMEYKTSVATVIQTSDTINSQQKEIDTILELVDKCKELEGTLREAEKAIDELTPIKQQIMIDINNLTALEAEKDQIDQEFMIVDIMRSILQPGKGIRKELLNIYFFDIYQTANELLYNTFGGKLKLHEFIITDKEFTIPFEYAGEVGSDVAYASSSQRATIAIAISLAIISKLVDKYSIVSFDESDQTLSPANKTIFVDILSKYMKMVGIQQSFIITHSPEYYESTPGLVFIGFPGYEHSINTKSNDVIEIK